MNYTKICGFLTALATLVSTTPVGAQDSSNKITTTYSHSWKEFPTVKGRSFVSDRKVDFAPRKGYANVIFFISADCLKCQRYMDDFREMERRFTPLNVRFLYVFSHDQEDDARGFATEHRMNDNAVIAARNNNHVILKEFKNPPLPTVYIGDRHGWLSKRVFDIDRQDLKDITKYLQRMTAY